MTETWKPVVGYEGLYEVSDRGRVRGVDRVEQCGPRLRRRSGVLLKTFVTPNGYESVHLSKNGLSSPKSIHSLVASAFLGPRPNNSVVRHMDGDQSNNSVSNLAYGTQSENLRDWPRYGGRSANQKLTIPQVREIRARLERGETLRAIAKDYGVAHGAINAIKQGRTFSYI